MRALPLPQHLAPLTPSHFLLVATAHSAPQGVGWVHCGASNTHNSCFLFADRHHRTRDGLCPGEIKPLVHHTNKPRISGQSQIDYCLMVLNAKDAKLCKILPCEGVTVQ